MIYLYRIFTFIVFYLFLPYSGTMALLGNTKWKQRLGFFPKNDSGKKSVWLHASSVGEVKVAQTLHAALTDLAPDLTVIVTVMTDAGYNTIRSQNGNILFGFIPLDYRFAVKRFMYRAKPDAAVFIETEIWPNIIHRLARKNIPIFLANGRLSEKSHASYKKFRKAMAGLFVNYRRLMVQSDLDRERYEDIGVEPGRIEILGSLKFDAPVRKPSEKAKNDIFRTIPFRAGDRILTAGSTRPAEEEAVLDCYSKLHDKYDNLKLIVAPRHLNRIDEVKALLEKAGYSYGLYTERDNYPQNADILLVDVIGKLNDLYAVSDLAFVGGTLAQLGGHNILEPVWAGTPVVYGDSIDNIRDSSEYILRKNFGCMVQSADELCRKIDEFFDGKLDFSRKRERPDDDSAARKTAQIILDNLS